MNTIKKHLNTNKPIVSPIDPSLIKGKGSIAMPDDPGGFEVRVKCPNCNTGWANHASTLITDDDIYLCEECHHQWSDKPRKRIRGG